MLRVLELFCGIGGVAAALRDAARAPTEIIAAVDIHRGALDVYRHNFPDHPLAARTIESLSAAQLAGHEADLWWLSPPCQPFTVRGLRRDAEDPRARPLLVLLDRIAEVRPTHVALENVAGFRGSEIHARLLRTLEQAGYATIDERLLCPSDLGVPNRRPRYFLVASRRALGTMEPEPPTPLPLSAFLDADPEPGLGVSPRLLRRYEGALHVVDGDDPEALANCFTSAYGRSPVRSGSYLRRNGTVRRFSPAEILRLLGFAESYRLPAGLPRQKAWRLVGNSLSLLAVRLVLAPILGLGRKNSIG